MSSAEEIVVQFQKEFKAGKRVTVVTAQGAVRGKAVLDSSLTTLTVTGSRGFVQQVPLAEVEEIAMGNDGAEDTNLSLDNCCVTLFLENGQFAALSFPDVEQRDVFAICTTMLVDKLRNLDDDDGDDTEDDFLDTSGDDSLPAVPASGASVADTGRSWFGSAESFPSARTIASSVSQAEDKQTVMKRFVRGLVKGMQVSVLSCRGGTTQCLLSLDKGVTALTLQRSDSQSGKQRSMPLESIHKVCAGSTSDSVFAGLPLDDFCVGLVFQDGMGLALRFNDSVQRDMFTPNLRMIVSGCRSEKKKVACSRNESTFKGVKAGKCEFV